MDVTNRRSFFLTILLLCFLLPVSLSVRERTGYPNGEPKEKLLERSSYFQLWYTGIEDGGNFYALRRFKVMLQGSLKPHVQYYIQGIFKDGYESNTDGSTYLQEAWIKYTAWKYGYSMVGQFKPPFGMERFTPDWKLDTIYRSQATDHLIPNGQLGTLSRAATVLSLTHGWSRSDCIMPPGHLAGTAQTTASEGMDHS